MKNVFYRISYEHNDRSVALFGILHNSFYQTATELQLGGITNFRVELLTAEEFNLCPDRPCDIPTE